MSLDITFTRRKKIVCPKCGEVVGHNDLDTVDSGGRLWFPFLEQIGYYVPYDKRTEENDELRTLCSQAGWLMDRHQQTALKQQQLVEALLSQREALQETIRLMQQELNNRKAIEEAAEASETEG